MTWASMNIIKCAGNRHAMCASKSYHITTALSILYCIAESTNSMHQDWTLVFFILESLRLSNMNETERWSVINVKCWRDKRWFYLRTASIIAYASFSTAGYINSLFDNFLDMNATGLPFWFKDVEIATSDASHSTTNRMSSLIDDSFTLVNSFFNWLKAERALPSSGNFVAPAKGRILSENHGIHLA